MVPRYNPAPKIGVSGAPQATGRSRPADKPLDANGHKECRCRPQIAIALEAIMPFEAIMP